MPHIPLNLDSINWESLVSQQGGSGTHFVGMPFQRGGMRGRGIGGILASIIRMIPTFLSSPIGQQIASVGKNLVSDVSEGVPVTTSLKRRARQSVKDLTGLGKAKRPRKTHKNPIAVLRLHKETSGGKGRSVLLR